MRYTSIGSLHPVLFVFLLFFCFRPGAAAQFFGPFDQSSTDFKKLYAPFIEEDEKVLRTWYHYVLTKTPEGIFRLRTFFPELMQMTTLEEFEDRKLSVRVGQAAYWFDNGNLKSKGVFKQNQRVGQWMFFHFNGNISEAGVYRNGKKSGQWGEYDRKGRLKKQLTYADGLKEGRFMEFDTAKNIINEGVYHADSIISQTHPEAYSFDDFFPVWRTQCEGITDPKELKACSEGQFLKFIYKWIQYPETARQLGVQGEASLSFLVLEDGSIDKVIVQSGLCKSIEEECLRVAAKLPGWKPPMVDGKSASVYYFLPIRFRLE